LQNQLWWLKEVSKQTKKKKRRKKGK
jgi:hypothetical protein